jgi:hypothetical protein
VGQDLALRASRRKGVSAFRRFGVRGGIGFLSSGIRKSRSRNHISYGEIVRGCIRAVKEKEGPVDRVLIEILVGIERATSAHDLDRTIL